MYIQKTPINIKPTKLIKSKDQDQVSLDSQTTTGTMSSSGQYSSIGVGL